jgi:hypothetical protein
MEADGFGDIALNVESNITAQSFPISFCSPTG